MSKTEAKATFSEEVNLCIFDPPPCENSSLFRSALAMRPILLIAVLLISCILYPVSYGVSFEKVHLVDFYVSNFVFRGDEVINKTNNVFEYDLLVEYMKVSFFFFCRGNTHSL